MKKFLVDAEDNRERADIFAGKRFPELSRAYIKRLFNEGGLTVNDKPTKPGTRLHQGDVLRLHVNLDEMRQIEDIDLPILYQDDDIVVIDKPAGVISHSRGKFWYEPSVASFMRQITEQTGERPGIVHRLDRATSGVMICAKHQEAMAVLQKQFSDRSVQKTYVAVVSGTLKNEEAIIDVPIERNPKKPQTFRAGTQGKPAQTAFKVLKTSSHYVLVELKPRTGRTHQLRVHLAYIGHPIVGDELYGGESAERLMLHARALRLRLPNGQERTFTSEVPKEFTTLLKDGQ
ncbi:MAG: RluA family pseudouridine synthase [Candidatus Saccharibacteria bacterium]|nr:RluA family pseudouridine synthase [Candidatus Saccharibacteria bacterium]